MSVQSILVLIIMKRNPNTQFNVPEHVNRAEEEEDEKGEGRVNAYNLDQSPVWSKFRFMELITHVVTIKWRWLQKSRTGTKCTYIRGRTNKGRKSFYDNPLSLTSSKRRLLRWWWSLKMFNEPISHFTALLFVCLINPEKLCLTTALCPELD